MTAISDGAINQDSETKSIGPLPQNLPMTNEEIRLSEAGERKRHWKRWGPYLSERAWGTVREDYSSDGNAWDYFPHDHARSRAYRWNEDGIAGICDRRQLICFALALWNERDLFLKERLFGLTGNQGNHGEDVKEYYFYLDSTPTHSYMKYLYKYPQAAFPYAQLVEENRRRSKNDPEYELLDTGVFAEDRYFDVVVEYAKGDVEDILIKITATNRGPESAPLRLLPTIWFRNTWSWDSAEVRPNLRAVPAAIELEHPALGKRWLYYEGSSNGSPETLFTENETNRRRLFNAADDGFCKKDGINDFIVNGTREAVSTEASGTKAAVHYAMDIGAGETVTIRLRLTNLEFEHQPAAAFNTFDALFAARKREADDFYATIIPSDLSPDAKNVMRQGFAGLLWSKQFYHYVVKQWLDGDPGNPPPPAERSRGRNHDWPHLYNADVISMPDKWEYPWYAAWDLAFHCVSLALVDSDFAKEQLVLLLREWYMHPNGQFPAYEWALGDVNPPVHAWAAWRVYKIDKKRNGKGDRAFLVRVFHKLLLNFTWWVNRKDAEGMNIFQGGFLGLDNIGVFNRSDPLPTGGHIEQSDGTSWMAMYTLNLMAIAMELAMQDSAYEDVASKFWEHFIYIAYAMNHLGHDGMGLWNEEDGFFYDVLKFPDGSHFPVKVRSMVGLIPLFAVETLEPGLLERLPGFKRRMDWFIDNRPDLTKNVASMRKSGMAERKLLSIVDAEQLRRMLQIMLDEQEFLSPHGIRALSRHHRDHPFILAIDGKDYRVDYEPAESTTGLFGGNSNWRGPVWFPMNYLLIEALQKFHHYFGDDLKVEFPSRSGNMLTLAEVASELSHRLTGIFLRDERGQRPAYGGTPIFANNPNWSELILFYEYFHGDTGLGLGASHQTGWTALVTKLLQQSANTRVPKDRRS
jgi:hypothetical protein